MAPVESNRQPATTCSQANRRTYPTNLRSTQANRTKPNHPTLALLFACHMRVRKDFRFMLLLANSSSSHLPWYYTTSPLTPNCFARQMQGTWRMPRLLPQANDRLNIYYSESFALLSSNLNPRVVHLQLYCGYHKETKAKAFIKQNNNEKYQRVPEMKVIQVQVPS